MAPSSGSVVVPLAMKLLRELSKKASTAIRSKLASSQAAKAELQPILVRNEPRQPIHPAAWLRQSGSRRRGFATRSSAVDSAIRRFTSSSRPSPRHNRASLPRSATASAAANLARTPFASTLRPNLTGGAIPRTAGGYSLGAGRVGGARHFSHTPAAPAEVVSNVSAAIRAFWLAGQRACFDGVDHVSGEKRFKAVTQLQDQAERKVRSALSSRLAPGSHIDFHISPTITTMTSFGQFPTSIAPVPPTKTLNAEGLLNELSVDFARAVKDLAVVLEDLKRLAQLGDLPLSISEAGLIRVSFPGCDARTVEQLSDEVGLRRGIIQQDENLVTAAPALSEIPDVALAFPLAPGDIPSAVPRTSPSSNDVPTERHQDNPRSGPDEIDWQNMMLSSTSSPSHIDLDRSERFSGYSSLHAATNSDGLDMDAPFDLGDASSPSASSAADYEGIQGIYRFWEECDAVGR